MDFFSARDDLDETLMDIAGDSEIQNTYSGAHILITGSSGFIGKLLLEKLLRTCDVGKIYLLLRERKNTAPHERLKTMLNDVVFERVKMEKQNISDKLHVITGDCSVPGLSVSDHDFKTLCDNVSFIFHVAAALNMEDHLRKAILVNVCATESLLKMAKKMEYFKAFVHVSTAYSHVFRTNIDEICYDTKLGEDDMQLILEKFDDKQIGALTSKIVGEWGNTYTFTKALAENLIQKYSSQIPVAVVRPSMVISTASEPIAGWSSNVYGPLGIFLMTYIGLLRVWRCSKDIPQDMVPADIAVNTILAVGWHTCVKKPTANNQRVFNVVSSVKNPLTTNEFQQKLTGALFDMYMPTTKLIGVYNLILVNSNGLFVLYTWYFHVLPAFLIDMVLKLTGKKARLMKGYAKIFKLNRALYSFISHNYNYSDKNVDKLWESMTPKDRQLFNFSKAYNWQSLMYLFAKGARVYLLQESMETIEDARKKYVRMRMLCISVYLLQFALIFYILHLVFRIV